MLSEPGLSGLWQAGAREPDGPGPVWATKDPSAAVFDLQGSILRTQGPPLFDARLPADTVVSVLAHIKEGVGTRKTARFVGVHRDTVTRYVQRAGEHAEQLHDELVAFSPGDERSVVR